MYPGCQRPARSPAAWSSILSPSTRKKICGTQGKNYVDLLRKLSVTIYELTEHMGFAISHSAEIFFVVLLEKLFISFFLGYSAPSICGMDVIHKLD